MLTSGKHEFGCPMYSFVIEIGIFDFSGNSADLREIKFLNMKMFFKSFLTLVLLVAGTAMMNGQTIAKVDGATLDAKNVNCNPASCTPAMCDAMVAAGLCTKEQAAACKAKSGSTKVASAKLERTEANVVTVSAISEKAVKTSSCAKTCAKSKAKCAKKSTP